MKLFPRSPSSTLDQSTTVMLPTPPRTRFFKASEPVGPQLSKQMLDSMFPKPLITYEERKNYKEIRADERKARLRHHRERKSNEREEGERDSKWVVQ